jgi:hypothetical protein
MPFAAGLEFYQHAFRRGDPSRLPNVNRNEEMRLAWGLRCCAMAQHTRARFNCEKYKYINNLSKNAFPYSSFCRDAFIDGC